MRKKKKIEELDEKYNKTTFTPTINRNYNVSSKVAPLTRRNEVDYDKYPSDNQYSEGDNQQYIEDA